MEGVGSWIVLVPTRVPVTVACDLSAVTPPVTFVEHPHYVMFHGPGDGAGGWEHVIAVAKFALQADLQSTDWPRVIRACVHGEVCWDDGGASGDEAEAHSSSRVGG